MNLKLFYLVSGKSIKVLKTVYSEYWIGVLWNKNLTVMAVSASLHVWEAAQVQNKRVLTLLQ